MGAWRHPGVCARASDLRGKLTGFLPAGSEQGDMIVAAEHLRRRSSQEPVSSCTCPACTHVTCWAAMLGQQLQSPASETDPSSWATAVPHDMSFPALPAQLISLMPSTLSSTVGPSCLKSGDLPQRSARTPTAPCHTQHTPSTALLVS